MENAELDHVSAILARAALPEEIFGQLEGSPEEQLLAARKVFLRIAKEVHPDTQTGTEEREKADLAFKRLAQFWEQTQLRLANGTYNRKESASAFTPFTLQTAHSTYTLESLLCQGDLCNLYVGTLSHSDSKERVLIKVALRPQDNDLVANEARILRHLSTGENYGAARYFVSQLLDAFSYEERATGIVRHITVLKYIDGLFSLKEVKEAYPRGIDAKDMAWIWRRLLVALAFAHSNGVIHGCVLPPHILLHPEQHGVVLIDWSYAVQDPATTHSRISALSSGYRDWYPPEVLAREEPRPGLDIFMAGRCMIALLGGDIQTRTLPEHVPWQIGHYLLACTRPIATQRLQDAQSLLNEFDELLERLWGRRTFHPFSMPGR